MKKLILSEKCNLKFNASTWFDLGILLKGKRKVPTNVGSLILKYSKY